VPPHIWEAKLHEAQLPAHLIAHLITMGQLHRDNRYDRMTDSFQQLVGHAPISAAEFARRHVHAWLILPLSDLFLERARPRDTAPDRTRDGAAFRLTMVNWRCRKWRAV
jgi:hypothetical protein